MRKASKPDRKSKLRSEREVRRRPPPRASGIRSGKEGRFYVMEDGFTLMPTKVAGC